MTNKQLNYFKMVITRRGVMNANTTIWSGNAKISAAKAEVETLFMQILLDAGIQEEDIKGTTTAKDELWITAAVLGVHICTGMRAYAEDIGNQTLYEMMHYKKSDLDRGEVLEALNKMNLIYSQAGLPPIASLLPFNITAANLADFFTAIQAMAAAVPQHGVLQAGKKSSTTNIKNNFKLLRKAGNKLNDLVHTLALTQPGFVQIYDNSCKIVDTGKGQMAEEVQLMPGEHAALFFKKFLPDDTFTVRNHSVLSKVKLFLSDTTGVPASGGVEVGANEEFQLTVPVSFKMVFGHYLIVLNEDSFDDAHVTAVLAHGKSHSGAAPISTT